MTLADCSSQPPDAVGQVCFATDSMSQALAQLKLGFSVPHFGCFAEPNDGFHRVREHSVSIFILKSELDLGRGYTGEGCVGQKLKAGVGRRRMHLTRFIK